MGVIACVAFPAYRLFLDLSLWEGAGNAVGAAGSGVYLQSGADDGEDSGKEGTWSMQLAHTQGELLERRAGAACGRSPSLIRTERTARTR